jgi:hypothetical protein
VSFCADPRRRVVLVAMAGVLWAVLAPQGSAAEVELTIVDQATRRPIPCRVHLKDSAGAPQRAGKLPFWHDHFVCAGKVTLDLPPGEYRYEVERGPEYAVAVGKLTVGEAAQSQTIALRRLIDMKGHGWWPGETHVHRPPQDVELLMQAEDLHVAPVITWWNARNLWAKQPPPKDALVKFDGNRFYHLMAGEDEREGGALLFFGLQRPLEIAKATREYPSPMQFLREAKRGGAWVDIEKPFWWDVPVWLASGQVDSIGIANNHMQREKMYPGEAWGKPRDKGRLPDPHGNGWWTQEIYYHALNCGLRIPPSAGSASGVLHNPVGYNRMYVHVEGELTYAKWWENLRAGRVVVTNGPLLQPRANGQFPGHVFRGKQGETVEVRVELDVASRDKISRIEVVYDGEVIWTLPGEKVEGRVRYRPLKFDRSGWFLVRAIADAPHTFRFASTGPYYVEIGPPRISKRSAQFFVDWVKERMERVKVSDLVQRREVLMYHEDALRFWQAKAAAANAE